MKHSNPTGSLTSYFRNRILDPRRRHGMNMRKKIESEIKTFFDQQHFEEVRTPLLVASPGMETHIRPLELKHPDQKHSHQKVYLPTSPEFAMKKLLAGGLEKIYQICPAFRSEPNSRTHHPEFTILEWYRAHVTMQQIQNDVENLFEFLALKIFNSPSITYQSKSISLKTPWPRLSIRELFLKHVQLDLAPIQNQKEPLAAVCRKVGLTVSADDTWEDLYFKIWLNCIEPHLPADQAVFVEKFPAAQAALATLAKDPEGFTWANRFEVYAGGLELGNAFEELTDPIEQRARFNHDMELREKIYGPSFEKNALDETFIQALEEGLPPSAGIAIGVDRMVMLFANESDIDFTLWLPSHWPVHE